MSNVDWRAVQKAVTRSTGPTASFGATVTNEPSLSDVDLLTANYDVWIPTLRQRYENIRKAWTDANAAEAGDFEQDLSGLEKRWALAHALAKGDRAIATYLSGAFLAAQIPTYLEQLLQRVQGGTDADATPAPLVYAAYVEAVRQNGEQGDVARGDYIDLWKRISYEEDELGVVVPQGLLHPPVVQGKPGQDAGMMVLKTTKDVPTPWEIRDWAKLLAIGVVAGLGVQLIGNLVNLKQSLSYRRG